MQCCSTCKSRSVLLRFLPRERVSAYQNAWDCNGKTPVSLTRRSMFVEHGRAGKLACPKAKRRKALCHFIRCLLNSCSSGSRRHHIRNPVIGCFLHSDWKVNNRELPTCLSK